MRTNQKPPQLRSGRPDHELPPTVACDDPLLTARQGAIEVAVSLPAFWKAVSDGRLPAPLYVLPRAPRWRRSELRAAVESRRMLPAEAKLGRRNNRPSPI
jgi:predicted DNA-binding transcriptional regulator AlpA